MEVSNLVTKENKEAICIVASITKQNIYLKNAVSALNELSHNNVLEFTEFGQNYGVSKELLEEVYELQQKLKNAIGRSF